MISSQRYSDIRARPWSIVHRQLSVNSYDRVKITRKKKITTSYYTNQKSAPLLARTVSLLSRNRRFIRPTRGIKLHDIFVGSGLGPWHEGLMWAVVPAKQTNRSGELTTTWLLCSRCVEMNLL